jgi:hypothetical protein
MGGKKSKPAKQPKKGTLPPTVTQIALVGSKGHGKKAFCQWVANNYNIPV